MATRFPCCTASIDWRVAPRLLAAAALILTLGLTTYAQAQAEVEASEEPQRSESRSAADVADAPLDIDAGGLRVDREPEEGALWLPRAVLFVPRWALEVVFAVPRFTLWAFDRFQVTERWKSVFFNETGTVGIFPVALVETGFGANIGGRFFYRDLFGHKEAIRLRASYGGRFRQLYSTQLTTGELLGERMHLSIAGSYEIYPKSRFFGIGNQDLKKPGGVVPPIDALNKRTAVATRYRHDDIAVQAALELQPFDDLALRITGGWRQRQFNPEIEVDDDPAIDTIYDADSLTGYRTDLSNIYTEIEASLDGRATQGYFISGAAPSTGWRVTGFVGIRDGLDDDPSDHVRYGLDVQRYINLYGGDRVLMLRAYVEAVSGDLQQVAFLDLPGLGGPKLLRGYDRDRFHDRVVTLGTVEYNYPIIRNINGYLFADVGRVWRSYDQMAFKGFRVGYGGGMQIHSVNSFLARLFIASSIDGGIRFNFSFDPIFDARSREESP